MEITKPPQALAVMSQNPDQAINEVRREGGSFAKSTNAWKTGKTYVEVITFLLPRADPATLTKNKGKARSSSDLTASCYTR